MCKNVQWCTSFVSLLTDYVSIFDYENQGHLFKSHKFEVDLVMLYKVNAYEHLLKNVNGYG